MLRGAMLFLVLIAGLVTGTPTARAAPPVDLALVLLTDVSKSMDDAEYAMVKAGYRAAFADPEVVSAIIGTGGGVAVAYVEFSNKDDFVLVKGWDVLTDAASAAAFGEAVALAPRTSAGNTALAAALAKSSHLLLDSEFDDARQVIDVVSDHPSDGGRSAAIRDAAVSAGITINAIPVISDDPIGTYDGRMTYSGIIGGVENAIAFYRRDVIGGPGAFVVEARTYDVFGEALKRKLLREFIASY